MKHPEHVIGFLQHIQEAIADAMDFLENCDSAESLSQDKRSRDAALRTLTIIKESTRRLCQTSPEFIRANTDIPWLILDSLYDSIVDEDFKADCEVLLRAVKHDFPKLKTKVASLLAVKTG